MEMGWQWISSRYIYLLCILSVIGRAHSFVDYSENTELIQQRAGFDVKLKCDLKGLVDQAKSPDVKVHWFFKQCIEASLSANRNCHDFDGDEDWIPIPCSDHFCKPDLVLRNLTEKYSGLYKCTLHPSYTGQALDVELVRTYQLEVKNTSLDVPEFLDSYPLNKSVAMGAQVVFQCRVHSLEHPTIRWFHRIPERGRPAAQDKSSQQQNEVVVSSRYVKYNGHTYELLDTAREKYISDQVYLSKLILNGVRYKDQGFYACAVISYKGHKIREAYLKVNSNNGEYDYLASEEDYEAPTGKQQQRTDRSEFWLLFLMPVGLAMLPLSVWLVYVCYKRSKQKTERHRYWDGETGEQCMLQL